MDGYSAINNLSIPIEVADHKLTQSEKNSRNNHSKNSGYNSEILTP